MKKIYAVSAILIMVYCTLLPIICIGKGEGASSVKKPSKSSVTTESENDQIVRILDEKSGKITEMSVDDYIFGVVAAEMPASYCDEALKAQTVASYTYMLFRKNERADLDYDVIASSSRDQAFITREEAQKKWGNDADKYCKKIEDAMASVKGYVMVDDEGKPILAAYHNISSGRTESALTVWGKDYYYLQPVESLGDLTASKYLSEVSFTASELLKKLSLPETDLSQSKWISGIKTSESGTVTEMQVCGKKFTGTKIRSALGLKSSVFTVSYADGSFKFRVQGHGHGVGMSQFGANYLARQNYSYVEILSWYYTDCKMIKYKTE